MDAFLGYPVAHSNVSDALNRTYVYRVFDIEEGNPDPRLFEIPVEILKTCQSTPGNLRRAQGAVCDACTVAVDALTCGWAFDLACKIIPYVNKFCPIVKQLVCNGLDAPSVCRSIGLC